MKLPSLTSLLHYTFLTVKRFPLAIIYSIVGSAFACMLAHLTYKNYDSHTWYWNVLMSCYLGMLLQVAIVIFMERLNLGRLQKMILPLIGFALIVTYYYSLPNNWAKDLAIMHTTRFILFSLGLHWLIAFMPFIKKGEMNGFWQYNKAIFLRILTAFLYSAVLFMGLSLAILAVDKLFGLFVNEKTYLYLFIVIVGIFNTCFFLAGFPTNYADLEQSQDYPKGLKVFTQFVLLPLITIYLFILYAYLIKILVNHSWPVGWVSYLVLYFSIAGILSLLLIHPIRFQAKNTWIITYSRFFYYALFPLIILLFFAIIRRISDYGITEQRYFVLLLALWLLFTAIYFSVSKKKNIKIIPQSLCIIAFLSTYGPWGVFNVSLHSQQIRFESMLTKNHLLVNGKIIKATKQLSLEDRDKLTAMFGYFVNHHGYNSLQSYYTQNLDSVMKNDSIGNYKWTEKKLMALANINYADKYDEIEALSGFNYSVVNDDEDLIDTKGFDYVISNYELDNYGSDKSIDSTKFTCRDKLITVCFNKESNIMTIILDNNNRSVSFNINSFLKEVETQHSDDDTYSEFMMTLNGNNGKSICKVVIENIAGWREGNKMKISHLKSRLLFAN